MYVEKPNITRHSIWVGCDAFGRMEFTGSKRAASHGVEVVYCPSAVSFVYGDEIVIAEADTFCVADIHRNIQGIGLVGNMPLARTIDYVDELRIKYKLNTWYKATRMKVKALSSLTTALDQIEMIVKPNLLQRKSHWRNVQLQSVIK
jgi:hypothetical protein